MLLQFFVVAGQLVHAEYDHIGAVLVFRSQLPDDRDAVHDGIARGFYFFHRGYDTVKICLDAVGHGTIGLVQMLDGHDIADVAEDDTGYLKLVVFHIRGAVGTERNDMVDRACDDDECVGNAAVHHKFPVLIENEQAGHRKDIGEGDRGSGSADHKGIKDTVSDHEIVFIEICRPALCPKNEFAGKKRKPA